MTAATRRQLRRQFRQQRRSLTPGQRRRASHRVGAQLDQALGHRPARHLALYLANDGELDLLPGLDHNRFQLATTYLPRLDPIRRGHLQFRLYELRLHLLAVGSSRSAQMAGLSRLTQFHSMLDR